MQKKLKTITDQPPSQRSHHPQGPMISQQAQPQKKFNAQQTAKGLSVAPLNSITDYQTQLLRQAKSQQPFGSSGISSIKLSTLAPGKVSSQDTPTPNVDAHTLFPAETTHFDRETLGYGSSKKGEEDEAESDEYQQSTTMKGRGDRQAQPRILPQKVQPLRSSRRQYSQSPSFMQKQEGFLFRAPPLQAEAQTSEFLSHQKTKEQSQASSS